jgi:hypothetical protein
MWLYYFHIILHTYLLACILLLQNGTWFSLPRFHLLFLIISLFYQRYFFLFEIFGCHGGDYEGSHLLHFYFQIGLGFLTPVVLCKP